MNRHARRLLLFVSSIGIAVMGASPALATFTYTTDPYDGGGDFTFENVDETTNSAGDPEPLYGNDTTNLPQAVGNLLDFDPLAAFASSASSGGNDSTASQLKLDIVANAVGTPIDTITITESGTYSVDASLGGTGIFVSIGGVATINERFSDAGFNTQVPGGIPVDQFVVFSADSGTWTLTSVIDVGAYLLGLDGVSDAQRVSISLDNSLSSFSEGFGSDASIQKTNVRISLPEPTTFGLMALGLFGAAFGGRRSRM